MVPPALRPQDAVGRPTRVLQPAAALPTPVANATAAGGAAAPTATAASAADAKNQSDDEDYYLELVKKEKYKDYDMLKDRYSFIAFEKCKETILNIAGISISNPTSSAEISDIVDRLKGNIKKSDKAALASRLFCVIEYHSAILAKSDKFQIIKVIYDYMDGFEG